MNLSTSRSLRNAHDGERGSGRGLADSGRIDPGPQTDGPEPFNGCGSASEGGAARDLSTKKVMKKVIK
jgi:hypothetical protein